MKYNKLGRTDMKVSHVCLGTMTWGCQNTEDQAHEQMDYALERGVNFFDTAELYAVPLQEETQGLTEKYIGSWFAKTGNRDKVILASKAAGNGPSYIHDGVKLGRDKINTALDESLSRLQTDYIDLYQMHWPQYPYPHHGDHRAGDIDYKTINTAEETDRMLEILRTLDDAVKAGKIKSFGLSNDTPWGVMKYLELAKDHNLPRVASVQNEFSLMYQHDDPYLAETCVHEDVSYLPYSSLMCGALSGKYLDGARPKGARWSLGIDKGLNQRDTSAAQNAVKAYIAVAEKHGLDVCQMALAFCYQKSFITSTIIGATTMEQLKSNIDAKDLALSDDALSDLRKVYCEYPIPY
ncbi:MAG: aldo/keto reductase [Alphaproteobacteria bacterium]|nr:MAG: aldo/keto reductase [Alphaproteobacteria bacterium]